MKRFFAALLLGLTAFTASAQTYIKPSQLRPTDGFVRKSPCQQFAGDNCGNEPPTWHITPNQCGMIFSTSSARNEAYQNTYSATGTQTVFAIPFTYVNTSHLLVTVGGVLKTEGVDYTVSAPGASGTVTFTVAPAAAASVVIKLKVLWDGDGATVTYPFNFRVDYIESLEVKVGGVTKVYSTDYTITGLRSPTGGTITFVAPPAAGTENISIKMVSITTKGVKYTVPTFDEFIAAG
jgi:hypothetical protein